MADRKRFCDGAPPNSPVWWDITPRTGTPKRGFGQTAFVAAATVGLVLSQVLDAQVSEDQSSHGWLEASQVVS